MLRFDHTSALRFVKTLHPNGDSCQTSIYANLKSLIMRVLKLFLILDTGDARSARHALEIKLGSDLKRSFSNLNE